MICMTPACTMLVYQMMNLWLVLLA